MWLFNRRNNDNVPSEINEYYQAEKRDRMGTTWLLSILTFVFTVVAVLGLFFGGRWAYRNLANRDNKPPVASKTTQTKQEETQRQQRGTQSPEPNPSPPAPTPAPSTPNPAPATPPAAPVPAPAPTPAPATAATPGKVPSTGPNVFVVALAVVAASYLGHLFFAKRTARE